MLSAIVSIAVAAAGCWLLCALNLGIDKERTRMQAAHDLLPALWNIHQPRHASARADVTTTLGIAVVVGALVAIAIDIANIT